MHLLIWRFLKLSVIIGSQLLWIDWHSITYADSPNRQNWDHIDGNCDPTLEGVVFAISGTGCGGNNTSFDTQQIYSPVVIKDIASADAPCSGISTGSVCFRMWYVGEDNVGVPRIGYAVSPDGLSWTRMPGSQIGGSVLGAGASGNFDSYGVSYFTVMRDGSTFKMWYSGYGASHNSGLTEGIGYATSNDGLSWTRMPGPLAGEAVLQPSNTPGVFDQHEAYVPFVIKDQATVEAPCVGIPMGQTCYRMWYEGANTSTGYRFLIGYATSPDGINWNRVAGGGSGGEVLSSGPFDDFDDNSVGIAVVIKDGLFYRMWYEAKDFTPGEFSIGHVVSSNGVNWTRPNPNLPVYTGSDDPTISFTPDHIWSHTVLKDGPTYRMWYTISTKPDAERFGYATMTPGTLFGGDALSLERTGDIYTVSLTTTTSISAGGGVLLTLPPDIPIDQITPGALNGFAPGATLSVDPAAISDAPAANTTRGALLIRLGDDELAGPKTFQFTLANSFIITGSLLVQTFDTREVLEYGTVSLPSASLTLAISDETTIEGDTGTTDAVFSVTLSEAGNLTTTVAYATANDIAIAPDDYLTATGILTFTPGITLQTIIVSIQGDTITESNETYFVNLSDPTNAILDDAQGQGTIADNDIPNPPLDRNIYLPLISK